MLLQATIYAESEGSRIHNRSTWEINGWIIQVLLSRMAPTSAVTARMTKSARGRWHPLQKNFPFPSAVEGEKQFLLILCYFFS